MIFLSGPIQDDTKEGLRYYTLVTSNLIWGPQMSNVLNVVCRWDPGSSPG